MSFEAQVKRTSINSKITLQLHKEKEMVAFRKLFPVLAIVAFLLGTATTASAQATGQPLVCNTNAGVPPLVRAEGYTELVGDIVLVCSGGNPGQGILANFQLFLNTNITSRLVGSSFSEALLLIDEPGIPRLNSNGTGGPPPPPMTPFCLSPSVPANSTGIAPSVTPAACNPGTANASYQQGTYTVFRAQQAAATTTQSALVWAGIPIVPPGSNATRTFRITNVRANAAGAGVSTSLVPTQIIAFLSISASQSLALNNPQQAVAFVQPGLQFAVRNCNGSGSSDTSPIPRNFVQCSSEPTGDNRLFNNPNTDRPYDAQLGLRFREGFQTAFKKVIEGTPGNQQFESLPGVVYNTESGFVRESLFNASSTPLVGKADSATRVAARFTNVPAGVRLFVSTRSITVLGSEADTGSAGAGATLVQADANGGRGGIGLGGSFVEIPQLVTLRCGATTAAGAEVVLTNGSGMAVWEVTDANPSAIDTLHFLLSVAFAANTPNNLPGLGTSSVAGSFAPFYAASTNANQASSTLPIPRFIDNPITAQDFRIDQCVTNLLFPFVTNQAGFDTGIAISNTSRDPFANQATRLQAGTCTLNYYGGTSGGGAAPAAQTSNANVEAGAQLLFVLSSGGNLGIAATPGFQGYIIAQCRFQYAHGFAFITDGPIGQARVAEGYLALVMDNAIARRTGSFSETLDH